MNIIPLFPTPLHVSTYKIEQSDKDNLTSIDFHRVEQYSDISVDTYVLNDPRFHHIKFEIEKRFRDYMDFIGVDESISFHITNSWLMRHLRGDLGGKHIHSNSIYSGLVYLNVDENSGEITFHEREHSERIFPNLFTIPMNPTMLSTSSISFQPKNDELYFFPSNLNHSIGESKSDIERYVLAFNFWLQGTLGESVGVLTL